MKVAIILKAPKLNTAVEEDCVIYADGAYKFKEEVGEKEVIAVVGDFDSLGEAPKNEKVVTLNVEKNFTDGERAVRLAVENGASELVIYGAYGGKIEHVLGNIALLSIANDLGVKASIKEENTITELFSGKKDFAVKKGGTISLIPYGGDCVFESSLGLYYPLNALTLTPSDTRGISNVAIEEKISIEIKKGKALIIYGK